MRVFIGLDRRQPIAYSILQYSIVRRVSKPVQIIPLVLSQLPITRKGLTEFTYSRFLVPHLCYYKGLALFLDADMLCLGDIAEIFALKDSAPVQVVKNKEKFEWPSLMLFDCSQLHNLTPDFVQTSKTLFNMNWAAVGELPLEWNFCVGYDKPETIPKLIHYTQGVPVWPETEGCDYAELWHQERRAMMSTCSFEELMGHSIHIERMANNVS